MRSTADVSDLEVRRAGMADVDDVRFVLDEASAWLHSRGIEQWSARFPLDRIGPAIERGDTWLARTDGEIAGTITLVDGSELPEAADDAGYVHRLAVRRGAAGLGRVLLDWPASASKSACRQISRRSLAHAVSW